METFLKYQLVAWNYKIIDDDKARQYMIPSLEGEVQEDLATDRLCS